MSTPSPWQWYNTPRGTTKGYNYYTPSNQQCYAPYYSYYRALGDFNGQTGFYSLADSYSNSVSSSLSWQNVQNLFNYIFYGSGNTIDIIDDANNQAGAIISEAVGGLFVLISAIFAICFFIKKCVCCCCCSKRHQQVQTFLSTRAGYMTQIVLYLILFGFIVAGTIIYGLSVDDLNNGIKWSSYSYGYQSNYQSGKQDLDCNYRKYISTTFGQQEAQVRQNPDSLTNVWLTSSGVTPLSQFDTYGYTNDLQTTNRMGYQLLTSLGKLKTSNQQCKSQIDSVKKLIGKLNEDTYSLQNFMPTVQSQINVTSYNANLKGTSLKSQLQVPTSAQLNTFWRVEDRLSAMNQGLHLASNNSQVYTNTIASFINRGITKWTNNGKQDSVRVVSLLVVLIPMSLILLSMAIAFIVCIFRFFFPKIHIPIILTGPIRLFINLGAYTVIFTTWSIWLVALAYYWVSNPFATTCNQVQPAYYSEMMSTYDKLNVIFVPYTEIALSRPYQRMMPYGDFLQDLNQRNTLFSTLDNYSRSSTMFNTSTVMSDLNINFYQSQTYSVIFNADLTVSFDYSTYSSYKVRSDALTTDSAQLNNMRNDGFLNSCYSDDTDSVISSLISYTRLVRSTQEENLELLNNQRNVYYFDVQDTRNDMKQQNSETYYQVQDKISMAVQNYRNQLSYSIYPAQAVRVSYDSTWDVLCSQIRSPLDGIWASAGMLAIFMIPAGFLLYKTARVVVEKKKPVARIAETNVNEQCFATHTVVEQSPPIVVATIPNPVPAPMMNSFTTITVVDQINNPQPSAPAMYPTSAPAQQMMYPTIDPNAMNHLETLQMKY